MRTTAFILTLVLAQSALADTGLEQRLSYGQAALDAATRGDAIATETVKRGPRS